LAPFRSHGRRDPTHEVGDTLGRSRGPSAIERSLHCVQDDNITLCDDLGQAARNAWLLISARLQPAARYNRQPMKHASVAALLAWLALSSSALSADITTLNGTVYHDAHVTAADPDGLHITHRYGVAKVPFEELPEALRTQYRYDKQKADAYRQKVAARQRSSVNRPATNQRQAQATQQGKLQSYIQNQMAQSVRPGTQPPSKAQSILAIIVSVGIGLVILALALVVYFLPTLIGLRKQNAGGIFLLNLLLGWTLAGWIAAFMWAWRADSRASESTMAYR
jgi:Superinfection immunity protein